MIKISEKSANVTHYGDIGASKQWTFYVYRFDIVISSISVLC